MLQYWTTWNFTWFLGSKTGIFNDSNALKTSVLVTSLLGGFMTYIYPRKLKLKILNYNYYVPKYLLISGDFIFHQIPLLSMFYFNHKIVKNNCGKNILVPLFGWLFFNYLENNNFNKIYGIKMYKLIISTLSILGGYGYCFHFIQNKNNLLNNK